MYSADQMVALQDQNNAQNQANSGINALRLLEEGPKYSHKKIIPGSSSLSRANRRIEASKRLLPPCTLLVCTHVNHVNDLLQGADQFIDLIYVQEKKMSRLNLQQLIETLFFRPGSVISFRGHTQEELDETGWRPGEETQINWSCDGAKCTATTGMVLSAVSIKDKLMLELVNSNYFRQHLKKDDSEYGKAQSVNAVTLCGFIQGKDNYENNKALCEEDIQNLVAWNRDGFPTSDGRLFKVNICIPLDKSAMQKLSGRGGGNAFTTMFCTFCDATNKDSQSPMFVCTDCSGESRFPPFKQIRLCINHGIHFLPCTGPSHAFF